MEHSFEISQQKPDHAFRTEIPNIIWELGLTPYELALYSHYKRVAGDSGCCFQTHAKIEQRTGISCSQQKRAMKRLRQPFDILNGKSLIKVFVSKDEKGAHKPTQILIVDVWRENGDFFRKIDEKKEGGVGPDRAEGRSYQDRGSVLPEPYKKNTKEDQDKNPYGSIEASPPCAPKASIDRQPKIQRAPHVATTEHEHTQLVQKYGEETLAKCYQTLSDWKEDTPKAKWKKCDNRTIQRWVAKAVTEADQKAHNPKNNFVKGSGGQYYKDRSTAPKGSIKSRNVKNYTTGQGDNS